MGWRFNGQFLASGGVVWDYTNTLSYDGEDFIKLVFSLIGEAPFKRRDTIKTIERFLKKGGVHWITFGYKEWIIDLEGLKKVFNVLEKELSELNWLKGKVSIEPEFEPEEQTVFEKNRYIASVVLYITSEAVERMNTTTSDCPIEIKESLERFKQDYPDPQKVGFIIMQFGRTQAHEKIVEGIKKGLEDVGLIGVRADEKRYHDDLYYNVLTFLYGCSFSVAIFERLEADKFNPNVALEVGYLFALGKPVCLLKDKTLAALPTDIVGRLYEIFDTQNPVETIPPPLQKWLRNKRII